MIFYIGLRIQKNNKKHQTRLAQQKTGWFYLVLNMRTIRYWPRFLGRDNTCCRGGLGGRCDRS